MAEVFVEPLSNGALGFSDVKSLPLWTQLTVNSIYNIFYVTFASQPRRASVAVSSSSRAGRRTVSGPDELVTHSFPSLPGYPEVESTALDDALNFVAQSVVHKWQH